MIAVLAVATAIAACGPRSGPPAPISHGGGSRPALSRSEAASGVVVVQPGDTLYAVARRTGTPVRRLIDANRLQAPYRLLSGQRLQIPSIAAASAQPAAAPSNAPGPAVAAAPRGSVDSAPIAPPPAAAASAGAPAALPPGAATASQTAPAGRVVMPPPPAPGAEASATQPAISSPSTPSAVPAPSTPAAGATPPMAPPAGVAPTPSPSTAPSPGPSAAITPPPAVDTAPQPRAGRFLWPVRGNIISSFGAKPGGLQNDGINIAAARGTPVRAAENGVVVYAGNELKGFGNLLLLRHADGWMSAYAHLDEILVARGGTVTRGQNVGKVGQSGNVASPQLHFELRRAGRAVDPRGMLAPVQTAAAN